MSSPPMKIHVICPECGHRFEDWWRSVNLDLDNFDEAYLDKCSSAVCPECGHKVYFETLFVQGDTFRILNSHLYE